MVKANSTVAKRPKTKAISSLLVDASDSLTYARDMHVPHLLHFLGDVINITNLPDEAAPHMQAAQLADAAGGSVPFPPALAQRAQV